MTRASISKAKYEAKRERVQQFREQHLNAPPLRKSLQPGRVVILLAGPYKGKRVVVVKALPSGNLLITGPFKVNGIPLRRVNPRYVIATSLSLPVEGLDCSSVDDTMFQKEKQNRKKKSKNAVSGKEDEDSYMSQGKEPEARAPLPEAFLALQRSVDNHFTKEIKKVPLAKQYLRTRFTLSSNQFPHAMKF